MRSVKEECLSKLVLFGERSLQRASTEFVAHYHSERNHQGKANSLLFPSPVKCLAKASAAANASAACFDTTAGPPEYLDHTGTYCGNGSGLGGSCQNGKKLGRPNTAATNASDVRSLHRAGISKSEIARRLQIGHTSVRRILG